MRKPNRGDSPTTIKSNPFMASSSFSSFFTFFTPSKPPPPPSLPAPPLPPKAPLPYPSLSSDSLPSLSSSPSGNRDGLVPIVASKDLVSVVCPSLAYSNTLFFRSAYNVQVLVDDNEPEEKLLNRFRREVMRAGVIQECKRRRFFENKQDEKKRKTREAAKRNRRRRPQFRGSSQDKQEVSKTKEEEDEDNWEIPEGDLPY